MAKKICLICGTEFVTNVMNKNTCSQECSTKYRRQCHLGLSTPWGEKAKENARNRPVSPNLEKGTAANLLNPGSQRGPQHRDSLVWEILSPGGEIFVVVGLSEWARQNAWRFNETEATAHRIASGFRQVARYLRGHKTKTAFRYKGWTLNRPPVDKDEYFSE